MADIEKLDLSMAGERCDDAVLPCPFCGSKNIAYGKYEHTAGRRYAIVCMNCMAQIDPGWAQSWGAVREMWNRRAQPENARQHALQTGVCPMCEDCPDGCPVETPNDSRNRQENEPLTLDELRQMDGEPVWIVEHPKWGHWELSEDAEDYLMDRHEEFYNMTHDDPAGKYGLHAMGWLAYRAKPERSEG